MSSTDPPSTLLIKSAALLSLLVIALGVTALFALSYTNQRSEEMLEHLDQFHTAEIAATETRANFKTQVQEWKNLLLRGSDPESFTRYHQQFKQRADEVQKKLAELQRLLEDLDEDSSIAKTLAEEHQALNKIYAEALTHYNSQQADSAFKVDAAVRGADRPLSNKIEQLATDMYQLAQKHHQTTQQNAAARYASLRQVTTIVASLTVLTSFALVFFANRRPLV